MKIRTEEELFDLVSKKISKSREKAIRRIKNAFPGSPRSTFQPFEVLRSEITRDSLLPFNALNSVISRNDVRELIGKKHVFDFEYVEGKTTVDNIVTFFFPRKKKKKKH